MPDHCCLNAIEELSHNLNNNLFFIIIINPYFYCSFKNYLLFIMSKKLTVLLLLAAAVFVGITAFKPKTTPPDKWKNLKVLPQDISEDSLKAVMRFYSSSLGVKCNFCHAMGS